MNYRHHFHAGNFADVFKHALLVQLARALQRKPAGFLYLDTHAGRGVYELPGPGADPRPEYIDGIGRLFGRSDLPPGLADYVALVRSLDATPGQAPRRYPGSPGLVRWIARPQDRMVFCELLSGEFAALDRQFSSRGRVSVQHRDGYGILRAMLPPPERRALVLIDPPFEASAEEEWGRIFAAIGDGLRRFPAGVYAVWYPLTGRAGADRHVSGFRRFTAPVLSVELVVDPLAPGLCGCGLAIVNPPWQFETESAPSLAFLGKLLGRAPGARTDLRWLVARR